MGLSTRGLKHLLSNRLEGHTGHLSISRLGRRTTYTALLTLASTPSLDTWSHTPLWTELLVCIPLNYLQ